MPQTIVLMAWRKPGMTPEEYRHHYETSHVPLVRRHAGDAFPAKYTRNYISRSKDDPYHAATLMGDPADFDMDSLTTLSFRDEDHFNTFMGRMMAPSVREEVIADEEKFLDRPKMKIAVIEREESTS